jgi:hypothetical protein
MEPHAVVVAVVAIVMLHGAEADENRNLDMNLSRCFTWLSSTDRLLSHLSAIARWAPMARHSGCPAVFGQPEIAAKQRPQ